MGDSAGRDRIEVRGIRAFGYHGVLPEERATGQHFVVDLSIETDISAAAETDDLSATINYAELANSTADIISGEPVNLIETLAQRIADACLAHPNATTVRVTVHKPDAPIGVEFDDVVVSIERSR